MATKTVLASGIDVPINQVVNGEVTPLYPYTRTANVKDSSGNTVDDIVATLQTKDPEHLVPSYSDEIASNLRFLRNDNTWGDIQTASESKKGVAQTFETLTDSTLPANAASKADWGTNDYSYITPNIVWSKSTDTRLTNAENDLVNVSNTANTNANDITNQGSRINTLEKNAVITSQLGVASSDTMTGVATLDTTGKVLSEQLPSSIDSIVNCTMSTDLTTATDPETTTTITPETNKLYLDINTNKQYRWSGTIYVLMSEGVVLGTTSSTAYRGDLGKIAYDHSQSTHAMVSANKTSASTTNGNIKIKSTEDGADVEVTVYTHPAGTNPHGTTKSDLGLGNVENKTSSTIRSEITTSNVTTALGFTPQNAATIATESNNGVMSSTQVTKLDNCMQTFIQAEQPAVNNCVWFKVIG